MEGMNKISEHEEMEQFKRVGEPFLMGAKNNE
jgi:hypothetical protein